MLGFRGKVIYLSTTDLREGLIPRLEICIYTVVFGLYDKGRKFLMCTQAHHRTSCAPWDNGNNTSCGWPVPHGHTHRGNLVKDLMRGYLSEEDITASCQHQRTLCCALVAQGCVVPAYLFASLSRLCSRGEQAHLRTARTAPSPPRFIPYSSPL